MLLCETVKKDKNERDAKICIKNICKRLDATVATRVLK